MGYSSKYNWFYIVFFYITYLFFYSKGTIAGDYERVFNISNTYLESGIGFFQFINSDQINAVNKGVNEQSFFKHNYLFFLIFIPLLKVINLLSFLPNYIYLEEFILAGIPGTLFFFSIILTLKTYEKLIDKNLLQISLISFFIGTYLINYFASDAYAESFIFFLISLRIFIQSRNNNSIILPVIDFFLIKTRITCIFFLPYFLFIFFYKKLNMKFLLKYFTPFFFLLILYNYISPSTSLSNRFIETIMQSLCIDSFDPFYLLTYQNLSLYFERIFLTFFSINLGIFFTFPCAILISFSFCKNFDKFDFIKVSCFLLVIFILALEEYWFLPAGISGNRGLSPFLLFFFPNYITGLKIFIKIFKKFFLFVMIFLLLLFIPSIFFRTTTATYAMCGSIENCEMKHRSDLNIIRKYIIVGSKELKCRIPNNFSMFNPQMHPGIYPIRVLFNKLFNKEETVIYLNTEPYFIVDTTHIVPETVGAKIVFLLNDKIILIDNSKILFKKIIENYSNVITFLVYFFKLLLIFLILINFYYNFISYLKKK
jgi:hypothetical protein